MKKKLLFIPLFGMLLAGCSIEDLMFWKKKDDQGQTSQDSAITGDDHSGGPKDDDTQGKEQEGLKEFDIKTYGNDFDDIFNDGGHIADKETEFTEYLKNQVASVNAIKSVSSDNLHAREWNNDLYLQFGSGSNAIGTLDIVFTSNVSKVEAEVLCYSKTFTPNGQTEPVMNVDSWSHFSINGKDNELSFDEEKGIEIMTFTNTFETPTKTIQLASSMGRVLLKQFKIYY